MLNAMLASAFFLEKSSVERPLKDVFAEFRLCLFLTDLLYWGGIVDAWCKFVPIEIFFIKLFFLIDIEVNNFF